MFIKTLSVKYDRIDVYKGIDVSKTNGSREWIICHYWYFLVINFRFQPKVSNGCHNLMQTAVVFNDAPIFFVKGNDYRVCFWYTSKDEAINLFKKNCLFKLKNCMILKDKNIFIMHKR